MTKETITNITFTSEEYSLLDKTRELLNNLQYELHNDNDVVVHNEDDTVILTQLFEIIKDIYFMIY